jgi:hypothetical protein
MKVLHLQSAYYSFVHTYKRSNDNNMYLCLMQIGKEEVDHAKHTLVVGVYKEL